MNARAQAFILLLFGGALTRLAFSDALLRYVRPSARTWVLLAGLAIVGVSLWNLLAGGRSTHADTDQGADVHGHAASSRLGWLVLAPVLAILVIAPPALGSYSAAREPARVPQPSQVDFPPLPPGNPATVSVLDFATRVIWDDGRTVSGRPVRLTGFVLGAAEGGFTLTRLVITCCAADALPVNIRILSPGTDYPVDSWVTVTGVYAGLSPSSKTLPELRATSVSPIRPPRNPYDA